VTAQRLSRRQFVVGALASAGLAASSRKPSAAPRAQNPARRRAKASGERASKPNIVFFMVDQLSAKWVEAALSGACPVPNIRRLQRMGVTFSRAITSNPLCQPTRATIATGLSTRGHGVLQNGYQLDPAIPTFMQLLQAAGWRTGAFGKVHFHPHYAGLYPDYRPYGFQVTHITEDPRGGEWLDWVREHCREYFDAALATIWAVNIPEFKRYGAQGENLFQRIVTLRKKFRWKTAQFPESTASWYTLPFPEEMSQTAWITARALEFIRETDPNQPLYAHISYVQPHPPFCPPAEYMEMVDESKIPEPVPAEWPDDPLHPAFFDRKARTKSVPKRWAARRYYFADIAHLDSKLGAVLDALEETGRLGNTYVIFLADHGELLMDHGFGGKAEFHYDACIRVPLVIAGPGVAAGSERRELVQLEDIFPTVLEMAGVPCYRQPVMRIPLRPKVIPGRSLLPLCRGEEPRAWREAAYAESYNNIDSTTYDRWARTIRTERFRYTVYPCGVGEQLFDLEDDPDEQHNLAGDPAFRAVRQELRDMLMDLIILQDYPHTIRELFAHGVH